MHVYIIIRAVNLFFNFIIMMIFARVFISWIPGINRYSNWVSFIDGFTDPIMEPIQKLVFRYINLGMIDISPMIAIFLVSIVENILIRLILMFF
ncbi:MAG: YggT family protein [Filifactoraceae bacterium]